MSSTRVERVKRQILRETTLILKEDLKDPRIGFVTVTSVELSPDLRVAKIFVSIMGETSEQEQTLKVLKNAAGYVRTQIGHRIRLRYTPEIIFLQDTSMEYVDRIFKILDDIKIKEAHGNKG